MRKKRKTNLSQLVMVSGVMGTRGRGKEGRRGYGLRVCACSLPGLAEVSGTKLYKATKIYPRFRVDLLLLVSNTV